MTASRARGRGRRSPVYLWLRKNHAQLIAAFQVNAPSWVGMAEFLGKHGVLDGDGKSPNARGVRDAWHRVRRDMAAAPAASRPSTPPTADHSPPGITLMPAAATPALGSGAQTARPKPHIDFMPAVAKGGPPRPPSAPAMTSQPPQTTREATLSTAQVDDTLRAVQAQLGGRRKTRMPHPVK